MSKLIKNICTNNRKNKFILVFLKTISIFLFAFICAACSTNPPDSPEQVITIYGNDSTVVLKYSPQLTSINKVVLIEDFANVSCNPCVVSNRILESLTKYSLGYGKISAIKFPTNFPGPNDPFYKANSSECNARMSYYNIITAPTIILDGILRPTASDSNDIKQKINSRSLLNTNFRITLNDSIIGEDYLIKFSIDVSDTVGIDFTNLVCYVVVTETDIEFTTPPGSNGETKFYDVMRVVFPTSNQKFKIYSGTSGNTINERKLKINSSWNKDKIHTVIFIQNKLTKEVLQSVSTY